MEIQWLSIIVRQHSNLHIRGWINQEKLSMRGDIPGFMDTVEPRFNEPQYNEVLGITKDFLNPTYTTI